MAVCLSIPLLLGACCGSIWYVAANNITAWEIPADFRGWAVIEWENPSCPELPRRGLTRVITIDALGRACTSNTPEDVPSLSRNYLVWPDGQRDELRAQDYAYSGVQSYFGFISYPGDGSNRYSARFIGTASEFATSNSALVRPNCTNQGSIRNECIP